MDEADNPMRQRQPELVRRLESCKVGRLILSSTRHTADAYQVTSVPKVKVRTLPESFRPGAT